MKVGIIGVGQMGHRIAEKLLENNVDVGVYDINLEAANALEIYGATVYETPKLLTKDYKHIITILPNAAIVKDTLLKENGILGELQGDSILIEMTTSIPSITKELADIVRKKGSRMIDAPVSGGISKAKTGQLSIMVGGESKDFEEVQPLLHYLGQHIIHVGDIGAGHTIKALNNLISATTMAITGEALTLGSRQGIDPNKMLEVINSSTGRSLTSELKFPKEILSRKFESGFTLDLMVKDLAIALNIAEEDKLPMHVASTAYQLWKQAQWEAETNADHTAMVKTIENMMGTDLTI